MTNWVLIPSLKQLFAEFDFIAPSRDHASDGSIGNAAHQDEVSDHNPDDTPGSKAAYNDHDGKPEVRAIDVDNNLNITVEGYSDPMEGVVQYLLHRCRSSAEQRLEYIIYNRRIWTRSSGWAQKTYTGASPHTEHAHFSGRHDGRFDDKAQSWTLEEIPVALTSADKTWIYNTIAAQTKAVADAVLKASGWSSGFPGRTLAQHADDEQVARNFLVGHPDKTGAQIDTTAPLARIVAAADLVIAASKPGTVRASEAGQ
jgi:hypothetical protein